MSIFIARHGGEADLGLDHGLADGLDHFGLRANIGAQITRDVVKRNCYQQIVDVVATRCVSPLVAITSKMPSCNLRMDTSKVPPPRS